MNATVWWKNGKHDTFCNIGGVEVGSSNHTIIYIIKENEDTVFVNANEVLYIEEESND